MDIRTAQTVCLFALLIPNMHRASLCVAQQSASAVKPKPAAKKSATGVRSVSPKPKPAPTAPPKLPEVLTNEAVIQMVHSGMEEAAIVAAIQARPASFQLDADHLVQLDQGKVTRAVRRAMLNKSMPPSTAAAAAPGGLPPAEPATAAAPAPAAPAVAAPPIPAGLDHAMARQGGASFSLADHPQNVLFVKSDSPDPKEAIADLLLSDVGLSLITMGLAPQLKMWNPYFGDTLSKVRTVGKGLLRSRGTNANGFEYETLVGSTAGVTLREGRPELLIPMEKYVASADTDLGEFLPVLLKLEIRDQDQRRLLTSRRVLLKETKKGRFDLKPTVDREELGIEQNAVPVDAELMPGHVFRIVPKQDLQPGEYALVFRNKAGSGDVPLRPTQDNTEHPDAQSPPIRGGLFRRSNQAPPAAQAQDGPIAGFLAWDFRVLK